MWPAPLAYQVWECTTSAPAQSWEIARSVPSVVMAGLESASSTGVRYEKVPASSRGAPNARTTTSVSVRSAFTSSATCTPAPP